MGQLEPAALQELLARVLLFLVEASGEPVLLSMLVLIFSDGHEEEFISRLPASRVRAASVLPNRRWGTGECCGFGAAGGCKEGAWGRRGDAGFVG